MNLSQIQQKLKAPKSQYNNFGKYHYRNCEDILEAVKPLLGESVLTLSDEVVALGTPISIHDKEGDVAETGIRFYVKATADFYEGGAKLISVTAYARESFDKKGMDTAQITGAASSYARKYALNGLFLIDDTKDADSDEEAHQPAKTAPKATTTAPTKKDTPSPVDVQKERVVFLLKSLGFKGKTKKEYGDAVFDMTGMQLIEENYNAIAENLAGKLEAKEAVGEQ